MRPYLVLAAVAALPAWCGEYAVLANGFRLRADRHEWVGAQVRLIHGVAVTELPASEIARFEPDDEAQPSVGQGQRYPSRERGTSVPSYLREAAERHGLPLELIHSVARAESGYRADAVSPKGAIGVMQLMPQTAAQLGANPFDPAENIEAGVRLLRNLLVKYDGSTHRALAAYNAGTGAVARHNGVPPYRETQTYVDRVIRDYLRQTAKKSANPTATE